MTVENPEEAWQEFRTSMKGKITGEKLSMLHLYYTSEQRKINEELLAEQLSELAAEVLKDHLDMRVDAYIRALVRSGFLYPEQNLETVVKSGWRPQIKEN
jgi:hypothetical protein